MDKLLWMRCFVRAVETGSFSAVARELQIGQPNVGRHIASLEKLLGTRLLHRSTRHLAMTPEGQKYYTARHARGEVHALLTAYAAPGTPLNALYAAERLLPQRATVFIEFISGVFAGSRGLNGASLV